MIKPPHLSHEIHESFSKLHKEPIQCTSRLTFAEDSEKLTIKITCIGAPSIDGYESKFQEIRFMDGLGVRRG